MFRQTAFRLLTPRPESRQAEAHPSGVRASGQASHAVRADIQVLRGAAILSVFAFHLWPRVIPTGYLGVDLFFVVSGFLMASLYDMSRLSAGAFYLKRATRILPAYYATIFLTVGAGAAILLPHELGDVVKSAFWAIGLADNISSWAQASYFDSSYFQPLLHLWSLGVEVQFYLLFPLIAWFWRKAPWAVVLAAAASFAACVIIDPISPKTSFFLTPFRLWEFAIGIFAAKAALAWPRLQGVRVAPWVGSAGLALIALLVFIPVPEEAHPGPAALAMAGATAAILMFGLPLAALRSLPGRALVWLGDYSYSIYLVHYPIICFVLYRAFEGGRIAHPTGLQCVLIIAMSLLAAMALHHGLENRFRGVGRMSFWRGQVFAAVVVMACVAVMPVIQSPRFSYAQHRISAAWSDRGVYRCGKLARILHPSAASCELTHGRGPTYLYVGDSHADAAKTALVAVARQHDVTVRMLTQNCAVGRSPCDVGAVLDEARRRQARGIILHASSGAITDEALAKVVEGADQAGVDVTLIESVPTWRMDVPKALYRHVKPAEMPQEVLHSPLGHGFRRIAVRPAFCHPNCDLTDPDGAPLYFDSSHLTLTGARRLMPAFEAALRPDSHAIVAGSLQPAF
jgi:peptidoglycan/LPS O-acetylase OafA/YrhL